MIIFLSLSSTMTDSRVISFYILCVKCSWLKTTTTTQRTLTNLQYNCSFEAISEVQDGHENHNTAFMGVQMITVVWSCIASAVVKPVCDWLEDLLQATTIPLSHVRLTSAGSCLCGSSEPRPTPPLQSELPAGCTSWFTHSFLLHLKFLLL